MRYEEGQKIWTVFFHNVEGFLYPSYSQFMPFDGKPYPEIVFRELTVTEHHKVRSEWENTDTPPACDGFLLKDSDGRIWHNQYPFASYGQISDSCDGLFRLHLELQRPVFDDVLAFIGEKRVTRQNGEANVAKTPHIIEAYDLMRELSQISHGVHSLINAGANPLKDDEAIERANKLGQWYSHIIDTFQQTTGLRIDYKPVEFKRKDGTVTTLDGHSRFFVTE